MKYTRYDFKKRNKGNFVFVLIIVLVLVLAFVLGTVIFKVFQNKDSVKITNSTNKNKNTKSCDVKYSSNNNTRFILIQKGIYADKNNAMTTLNSIKSYPKSFPIEEGGKTRVCFGFYYEKDAEKLIKDLKEKKIENSSIKFDLSKKDLCDIEIVEILNAHIQIVDKLSENGVKSVKTDEFKKWVASLQQVKGKNKNLETLNKMKSYISKMPKELNKDKKNENYSYIYNILKAVKTNS
ncbi:hypothetical protein [Clostridium oceanicum]|uniref:SPOR domain-containing protein n=1 Tax=Clostridium oceanicum TaxID=1543 RepID=A0ABP3V3F6_9CLOT